MIFTACCEVTFILYCRSSHALKIADRLGLPKRIIHEAETQVETNNLGKNMKNLTIGTRKRTKESQRHLIKKLSR